MGINAFIKKVKKRETGFYDFLYVTAKRFRRFEVPYIPLFHDMLYYERRARINAWRTFWRIFYHQPVFRGRCSSCGKNFHIYHSGQGIPLIMGDLNIEIGDNVKIYDRSTLAALTIGEKPTLTIGDGSNLSCSTIITVGNRVEIGSGCMIGCRLISDNPGHNVRVEERDKKLDPGQIGRVIIGDHVWAALDSMIIGDVKIGRGSIIAARSVVTKSIPPMSIVAGNPAKVIKRLDELEDSGEESSP